jgi:7,8-dihydropterin-6-yl-methyl-4-(beta-D-ribofuranosyl)aminobenzene 5'-phosphate synthase
VPGHGDHDDRQRTASQSTDVTILGSTLQRIAIMNRDRLIEVFRYESHLGADSPSRSAKALTCVIMICREVGWHAAFLAGRIGGEAVSSMCDDQGYSAAEAAWSAPRVAEGPAVDPVRLPEVDEVRVTTMVDNIFDALLASAEGVTRASRGAGRTAAAQFAGGQAVAGLRAEHGFSALVTVQRGNASSTLLFDTGASPDALAVNAERLGIDVGALQGVVLSHGHYDHAGGFDGLARLRGRSGLPLTVHPAVWTRRRLELPAGQGLEMPTLSRGALQREGFEVIERRQPSLLAGGILITGEVDRVTDFEHGMPQEHQAWDGNVWRHDPAVIDDQALVINVRGRGLVIITGCGHAGVVNIIRHAIRLTGVSKLLALIGGFHLSGPAFEPVIGPTVAALTDLAPELIVPAHCTGWRAQHTLAAALPHAWVQTSVGTTYTLSAPQAGDA